MTIPLTITRLPLLLSDWLLNRERQSLVISSWLSDAEAAEAEREALSLLN